MQGVSCISEIPNRAVKSPLTDPKLDDQCGRRDFPVTGLVKSMGNFARVTLPHDYHGTMTTDLPAHDSRMTPDFNYTLERSPGDDSRLHATETRPRVCEPSGKARLRCRVGNSPTSRRPRIGFWP
jgi:hypothetical protein